MNKLILWIILVILLLSSCKVTDSNECSLSEYKDVEIEFGYISQNSISQNYKLTGSIVANNFNKDTVYLNEVVACNLFDKTTQLFFKTQTLNVPADSNNFFIYNNKKSSTQLRALWNPLHTNKGNEEFKMLYKEYMDVINSKDDHE